MNEFLLQVPALKNFSAYFLFSTVLIYFFQKTYVLVTPYDEWKLIEENNSSAAIAFVGSILGFILALASASVHSVSLIDFVIWGIVAMFVQVLAFLFIRILMPKIVMGIEKNEMAAGITLGGLSIGVGILNASCLFT